ncbi:MAG: hypothetical protein N2V75_01845 [Methanophagales archaeon]|nr:hypothetical protein [Methanophagales archaeon]
MKGRKIKEIEGSCRGMYIRNNADIPLKWKDIRNSYISPNWKDMRSIADMNELGETVMEGENNALYAL